VGSSVGMFDWIDPTGAYDEDTTVLAPELLLHTNSNQGPFLDESGNHTFEFSLTPTQKVRAGGKGHADGVCNVFILFFYSFFPFFILHPTPTSKPPTHYASPQGQGPAWRAGAQLNHKLRAVLLPPTVAKPPRFAAAGLPPAASLLNVTSDRVWVTALKKELGVNKTGVILRLFDVCGHSDAGPAPGAAVGVSLGTRVTGLAHTDIVELNPQPLPTPVPGEALALHVGRCSIETYRLDVGL